MSKKLYEENNIRSIGDAIRAKNGTSNTYTTAQMAEAVRSIKTQPILEELNASENGTYTPSSGKDGFSRAVVNVQPKLEELNASANGSYTPSSGKDGFSRVNVNVPSGGGSAVLVQKTITANGTYNALLDDEADGYSEVVVAVPSSEEPANKAIHIWTKSAGGNDAAMYYQLGTLDPSTNAFYPTSDVYDLTYGEASSYAVNRSAAAFLSSLNKTCPLPFCIRYSQPNWSVAASIETKYNNTIYEALSLINAWTYDTSVDFYVVTV